MRANKTHGQRIDEKLFFFLWFSEPSYVSKSVHALWTSEGHGIKAMDQRQPSYIKACEKIQDPYRSYFCLNTCGKIQDT